MQNNHDKKKKKKLRQVNRDETQSRWIVTRHAPTAADSRARSLESVTEVIGCRYIYIAALYNTDDLWKAAHDSSSCLSEIASEAPVYIYIYTAADYFLSLAASNTLATKPQVSATTTTGFLCYIIHWCFALFFTAVIPIKFLYPYLV